MTFSSPSWENRLLALAYAPLEHNARLAPLHTDRETLDRAFMHCAQVTARHSQTFYMAAGLLPPHKRRAVHALYAFCRISDDLVDRAEIDLTQLQAWRERALGLTPQVDDLVTLAWAETRIRYGIPIQYAHQLINGVAQDISVKRYQTFDDLAEYAYNVAATVGLMAMHIIGFQGRQAVPFAIKLGVALQLTNILRDIGEDWQRGRLYLPLNELARFGVSEADVAAGRVDDRWRALMRFQIERARQLYDEAAPGMSLLHSDGCLAIAAAAEFYQGILQDIEKHDYSVFTRRAYLNRWAKLRRLPGIWWRSQGLCAGTSQTKKPPR